jgi:hypothetical protein
LHNKRLEYLYSNPNDSKSPKEKIEKGETGNLIKLTRARLEMEKLVEIKDKFNQEDLEVLRWFFTSTEDLDKRKFIFGKKSLEKLQELKNGFEWMKWLKNLFDENTEEMKKFAEKEINRQKPTEKEKFDPKYKVKVRIQSQSHSIKNNAFQKWNEGVRDVKLYKVDKKHLSNFAKSEMIIELFVPKAIPIHGLWEHSLFIIKTFIISLNIGSRGIFWWNVSKDIDNFFEYISDLEADKKDNIRIGMTKGKSLTINWDEARFKLDQKVVSDVMLIDGFLIREHGKLEKFLKHYALAMTLFSKTDIHLRLEANAFEEFFNALKESLLACGDWDGSGDLLKSIQKQFAKLDGVSLDNLEETIKIGENLKPEQKHNITLTEVVAIKLYCDLYIYIKANDYAKKRMKQDLSENKNKKSTKSTIKKS